MKIKYTLGIFAALVGMSTMGLAEEGKKKCDKARKGHCHKKILEKFDKDGDGKLSEDEKKAMREAIAKRREKFKTIFEQLRQKYDSNGDGELSDDEKKAMREDLKRQHEEFKAQMLQKYDADGDGKLSEDERKEAREAEKQELVGMFDADGDGDLKGEERENALQWILENRPFHIFHKIHKHRGCHGDKPERGDRPERGDGTARPKKDAKRHLRKGKKAL